MVAIETNTNTAAGRLQGMIQRARTAPGVEHRGRVVQLVGLLIESEGPLASVGEVCRIYSTRHEHSTMAEVVGFRNNRVLLMPLGEMHGVHPGSEIVATGRPLQVAVSDELMGRVLDGLGNPLDEGPPLSRSILTGIQTQPPHPLRRQMPQSRPLRSQNWFRTDQSQRHCRAN